MNLLDIIFQAIMWIFVISSTIHVLISGVKFLKVLIKK